jgi:hypothetical protein
MSAIDHEQSSSQIPATRSSAASEGLFLKIIYLSAIGLATFGWLWFIAWCVMGLMA